MYVSLSEKEKRNWGMMAYHSGDLGTVGDGVCVVEEGARVSVTMNRPWGLEDQKEREIKKVLFGRS